MPEIQESQREGISWHPRCTVEKYSTDQVEWVRYHHPEGVALSGEVLRRMCPSPEDGRACDEGNGVVLAGLANLALLLTGAGGHPLAPGRACFGVGSDGVTEFSTELAHLSNDGGEADGLSFYQPADQGYPVARGTVIEAQATFTETQACFDWREWGLVTGAGKPKAGPVLRRVYDEGTALLMNRKAPAHGFGTKELGVAWTFKVEIELRN